MLDQAEIDRLVGVPKAPFSSPTPQMPQLSDGHLRSNFEVQSENGADQFLVFVRVLETLNEDFSIGLVYKPRIGGKVVLLRCNGDHGEHLNRVVNNAKFSGPHIHSARAEALARGLKEENYAEPSQAYFSWEEAFRIFIGKANILGLEHYFPFLEQPGLFEGTGEAI